MKTWPNRARGSARREVEILSRMKHPCIIQFLGACFEPPCCFVTELAEGGSLHLALHSDTGTGLR